jgi:hypothetical protein
VEKNQKQRQYHDTHNNADTTPVFLREQDTEEIVPGVPIIRSNTPRPSSFEAMLASAGHIQKPLHGDSLEMETGALPRGFPAKAPSAPPLPEELVDDVDVGGGQNQILGLSFADAPSRTEESSAGSCPHPHRSDLSLPVPTADQTDFVWLFEYGLEMDVAILNSRERLNGQACLHGPAVLKGYTLMLGAQRIHNSSGPIIVALVPATDAQTEVWGVLYRVPRRLLASSEFEPSLLDTIHAAIAPQKFFVGAEVVVQDAYQNREVTSVTYIATKLARQQLQLVEADQSHSDSQFMQRLVEIARQQKLPEDYIRQYLMLTAATTDRIPQVHREDDGCSDSSSSDSLMYTSPLLSSPLPLTNPGQASLLSQREQHTDALPAFKDDLLASAQLTQRITTQARSQLWLVVFSLYLAGLVLILLLLAVVQGMGVARGSLTGGFTPLGVPWQVLIYGLLGGCVSCIVSLSNKRTSDPPLFVVITWFTRPFVGSLLAIFSYILLTSGLFMLGESIDRHPSFFWLAGILAGLCEWWLFCRRKA